MIRNEHVRFKLLRNGVEYGELLAGGNSPTLRMSSSGEIKMSLQGTFLPRAVNSSGKEVSVDWMADEIQPTLIIDGVETPIAVLMPAAVEPQSSMEEETIEVQAYDRCWRVRDTKVEGALYLSAGTGYIDAVEGLLTSAGIATIIKTPINAVLAEDRQDWETGTSYLTIVNDLLKEINYKQLWFNASGFAILEPASTPSAENIKHVFTDQKPNPANRKEVEAIRVFPHMSRKTDIYQAPNVFLCICSNPDKSGPMTATAENTNPQSPLSIMRRGRRIVQVVRVNNIESQAKLEEYANQLLYESMTTGETISIETQLLPDFGVEDVAGLRYDDVLGVCVEKSWTMTLGPGGTMTHELEKVVINIG